MVAEPLASAAAPQNISCERFAAVVSSAAAHLGFSQPRASRTHHYCAARTGHRLLAVLLLIGVACCSDTGIGAGVGAGGGTGRFCCRSSLNWRTGWGSRRYSCRTLDWSKVITTTTDRGSSHRAMATPFLSSMPHLSLMPPSLCSRIDTGSSNSPRSSKQSSVSSQETAIWRTRFADNAQGSPAYGDAPRDRTRYSTGSAPALLLTEKPPPGPSIGYRQIRERGPKKPSLPPPATR
jgi:hypothetical protein